MIYIHFQSIILTVMAAISLLEKLRISINLEQLSFSLNSVRFLSLSFVSILKIAVWKFILICEEEIGHGSQLSHMTQHIKSHGSRFPILWLSRPAGFPVYVIIIKKRPKSRSKCFRLILPIWIISEYQCINTNIPYISCT